MNLEAQTRV